MFEHEEGFNKTLRQAFFFLLGVADPYAIGFDIEKDIINDILVQLEASLTEEESCSKEGDPTSEEEGPDHDDGVGGQ